jgi:hypothetical protein
MRAPIAYFVGFAFFTVLAIASAAAAPPSQDPAQDLSSSAVSAATTDSNGSVAAPCGADDDSDDSAPRLDIFLASDRLIPASAALTSVCVNTHCASRLTFFVVVSNEEAAEEVRNVLQAACGDDVAAMVRPLSDVEDEIAHVRGDKKPTWLEPSVRVENDRWSDASSDSPPFAVRVPPRALHEKHATGKVLTRILSARCYFYSDDASLFPPLGQPSTTSASI